jgi:hypothetical protein
MRSPTTVGDPCPAPGIWARHKTLFVSLHSTGGVWPGAAMPSRVGPRHSGQSVAGSGARAALAERDAAIVHHRTERKPGNTLPLNRLSLPENRVSFDFTGADWPHSILLSSGYFRSPRCKAILSAGICGSPARTRPTFLPFWRGVSPTVQTVETVRAASGAFFHRAEAAVLMRPPRGEGA